MATEIEGKRYHMQRRGTMDEIHYLMNGLKSGEFYIDEDDENENETEASSGAEKEFPPLKSQFNRRLDRMTSNMETIRTESEAIRVHANLMYRDMTKLNRDTDNMDQNLNELELDIDDFEMFNRENNVLIIGLPEARNEDPIDATLELFSEKLDLHLDRDNIIFAQRISQRRHLMVQFLDYDSKEAVIHARRKLKGSRISIYEDLSPRRFDLLNRARSVEGVNAWTVKGRITAIQNFVKYRVDSMADVTKLRDNSLQPGGGVQGKNNNSRCIFRYKMI